MYSRIIRELCRRLSPLTQRLGFVLSPLHFYFPIPDTRELDRHKVWEHRTALTGIDWNVEGQITLLRELAQFGDECNWDAREGYSGGIAAQYAADNPTFGFASGMLAHAMVRYFKPSRITEVGVGWSSFALTDAVLRNQKDGNGAIYRGIDPFPPGYLPITVRDRVTATSVQEVPVTSITELSENDIFFIDSSHVLNTGSDVQYLYLEVLPKLAPGVIVHIHDIQLPFEYPREYAIKQRWFWNEQYLLQAFLANNSEFEILLAGHWLCVEHSNELKQSFPNFDPQKHSPTGSFWMRRKPS